MLPLASSSLLAQNSQQVTSGTTVLTLDSTLVTALATNGITVTADAPATLSGSTATFPITTGSVDLDTLVAVVSNSGALTFTDQDVTVIVGQFSIVAQQDTEPVALAEVIVNGTATGLYPAFDITGNVTRPATGTAVALTNLNVTLTAEGASLLNNAFGISSFAAGQVFGSASITGSVSPYTTVKPGTILKK
jgi:hypothetical protein